MAGTRWVITAAVVAVVLAGCTTTRRTTSAPTSPGSRGSTPASSTRIGVSATSPPTVVSSAPGHLAWSHVVEPEVADTAVGLFLDWLVSRPGSAPIVTKLARVDRSDGHIEAVRQFDGAFSFALAAAGSLWVTTSSPGFLPRAPGLLWRLDPKTLEVRSRLLLPSTAGGASLAVAAGNLWVAAGARLERVSLLSGHLTASVSMRDATSSSVAANAAGTVLVVGEAVGGGTGTIERRNPTTGALLATSTPLGGVSTPVVGGVIDGTAWVSEATGMMGYVQQYRLAPLAPIEPTCHEGSSTRTCVTGTNGIEARVVGDLVWLTQSAGGPTRNACVDPATGDILAPIVLSGANDEVLAIGPHHLFIASPAQPGNNQIVTEEPIPAACHAA